MSAEKPERYVLKVGNEVLLDKSGNIEATRIASIVDQIVTVCKKTGALCILVSSGAVPLGRKILGATRSDTETIAQKQLFASTGQAKLMRIYDDALAPHEWISSQAMATTADLQKPCRAQALRTTLNGALYYPSRHILPIINANDPLDTDELGQKGGNNRLAGSVAEMMDASHLIIMTKVPGILRDTHDKESVISHISTNDESWRNFAARMDHHASGHGRFTQKCEVAHTTAEKGITAHIVNGLEGGVLQRIFISKKTAGTMFEPAHR